MAFANRLDGSREKSTIFVLNGPNLNLLGTREPHIYGDRTLDDLAREVGEEAGRLNVAVEWRQTNHEGVLIDWLHEAHEAHATAVLLNAGAYTHTSVALFDAIRAITTPVVEVHLSDPTTREPFRRRSFIAMAGCPGFKGKGLGSYIEAMRYVVADRNARTG